MRLYRAESFPMMFVASYESTETGFSFNMTSHWHKAVDIPDEDANLMIEYVQFFHGFLLRKQR